MPGLARVLPHFVSVGIASSVCVPRVLRGQWEVTDDKQDYHEVCGARNYDFNKLQYIETKRNCKQDALITDARDLTEATCSMSEVTAGLEGMYSVDFAEGSKCSYWRKETPRGAIYVDEFWTRFSCPATLAEALLQENNFDWNVLNNYDSPAFKMRCTQGCGNFDCVCPDDITAATKAGTAATTAGPSESTAATTAATTVASIVVTTLPATTEASTTKPVSGTTLPGSGAGGGGPSASMPEDIAAADALAAASAKFEQVGSTRWLDQSVQWSMPTLFALILAGIVLFALRKSRQEAVADEQDSLVSE